MLYPLNKYLVVEPLEEDQVENQPTVLLPAGVDLKKTTPFCTMKLVEPNANSSLRAGMTLVAHSHMVEEAEIGDRVYYLLLESQVVGFIGDNES
tara:strand:+ start:142 stop:423 length:282 start_codon:yes stop_codon:yes gene_type:complete